MEAKLAQLADPRAASLVSVDALFSKWVSLPGANTRGDIQKALRAGNDKWARPRSPAASIFQRAQDELLAGKITMRGRPVRPPKMFRLDSGSVIEFPPFPPLPDAVEPLEIIPGAALAELRFIDREGIEAVPDQRRFPAREFPRWRDLSIVAEDVRRVWPFDRPIATGPQMAKQVGRPKGTRHMTSDAPIISRMKMLFAEGQAKSLTEAARRHYRH